MIKYSRWKEEDVIKLFRFIEAGKAKNAPLVSLFSDFASTTGRKPNSVRNYYYMELKSLAEDPKRCKKLKIDLSLHQKMEQKEFAEDEAEELVQKIDSMKKSGVSVRKACLSLANGDINTMVRYQNKYRAMKKSTTLPNNVVQFTRPQKLTESDINSLFLGLVKLVKRQAEEEQRTNFQAANEMLKKTIVKLAEKENEIKALRQQFKIISQQKSTLEQKLRHLRCKSLD